MFHPFKIDEDQEPTVLGVLIALLLAIPFCLAGVILLTMNHKQVSSAGFAGTEATKHVAGNFV